MKWTVIMLLEGGGDADVTLGTAHVEADTIEEAVLEAWEPFAMGDGPRPSVVGLIVQQGRNEDVSGAASGWLRTMMNLP